VFTPVLIFFLAITNFGQKVAQNTTAKILDEYLTRISAFGYSGAVIVEKDGKIILRKGYGFANKEKQIPFTLDTPFSVASISKQFTAAAILKLEEQGKLNLNDPITKFIKDVPEDKKAITIHQLLTHTAGFGDNYSGTNITDQNEAIKEILKQSLANPVGSKYLYSNDGYDLAGAIVEIVSGKDLRSFIRQNLFEPTRMKTAGFIGESNFWKRAQPAHPYNYYTDNGSPQFDKIDWDGLGSADVIVSANDLYKWELSLRENNVLSAGIKQKMFSPYSLESDGSHYGYGWHILKTERGTTEYYHGGSNIPRGFTASYSRYPDERTTIIIFVNTMIDEVGFLRAVKGGIVNITFDKKIEMPPSFITVNPLQLKKYAGIYQTDSGSKFVVQFLNDNLMIGAIGQEAIDFLTTPDKELVEKLGNFNELTETFIEKIVSDPITIPALKITFDSFKQRNGNYKGFDILGTYPVSTQYKVSTSFVKMRYERGDEIIRLVRRADNVYSIAGKFYPALTPLKLQKNENFVAYYPLLQKTVRVKFEIGGNKKIANLILENGSQTLNAKRLP
jgi:CubicO group peptidase (beta-lactamase class C family)